MARIAMLGAGDMGAALLTPLHAGGHELRLWGTERDDAIIAALSCGEPHPRLGTPLPPGLRTYRLLTVLYQILYEGAPARRVSGARSAAVQTPSTSRE